MRQQTYPPGWNEERVKQVLAYYEQQSEEEMFAEDEAAFEKDGAAVMEVPYELIATVRELIAEHRS